MANTTFQVRNYIRAKSVKGLRSLMFKKQLELKMRLLPFDITYASGYWFAWYYEDATDQTIIKIESESNGTAKNDRG